MQTLKKRMSQSLRPTITDSKSAADASLQAAVICYVISGINACLAVAAIYLHHPVVLGFNGSSLVDAALFGVCGYFIGRHSRVAAIVATLNFVAGKVYGYETGSFKLSVHSFITVLFLIYLLNGLRGTFAHAKFQKSSTTSPNFFAPSPETAVLLCGTQKPE